MGKTVFIETIVRTITNDKIYIYIYIYLKKSNSLGAFKPTLIVGYLILNMECLEELELRPRSMVFGKTVQ